jgi:hypothetical protein
LLVTKEQRKKSVLNKEKKNNPSLSKIESDSEDKTPLKFYAKIKDKLLARKPSGGYSYEGSYKINMPCMISLFPLKSYVH